jgi:hypothetical protein
MKIKPQAKSREKEGFCASTFGLLPSTSHLGTYWDHYPFPSFIP